MNSEWAEYLRSQGASLQSGDGVEIAQDFGEPDKELLESRDGSVVAPLSRFGVLRFTGDDALEFLHGQLSSDVKSLAPDQAQYSAYCSAKGRVLADFLLWRTQQGEINALLSRDLLEKTAQRLRMFVLRAKVRIEDVTPQFVLLGVSGRKVGAALSKALGVVPEVVLSVAPSAAGTESVLHLDHDRYLVLTAPSVAQNVWTALAANLATVGEPAWRWLEIRAGVPWVSAATQDEFVPQMANLDLIGAVNFQKGCYPGQEIVARTQYLGKLKRRLYRMHADVGQAPSAATNIYCAELGSQACGMVVEAVPAPGGGCDLLAVVQIDAALAAPMHLESPQGPALSLLGLPYRIPQAA